MLHTTLCPRVAAHNDQTTLDEDRMSAAMLGGFIKLRGFVVRPRVIVKNGV